MDAHFQLISDGDLARTIELMREFYAVTHMHFDEEVARTALRKTLLDSSLGSVYLVTLEKAVIGYFVLTFCFSLEFHGKFALLDEIYVREAYRRQKIGESIVAFCENICRKMGIRALRLETGHENEVAQNLYRKMGFAQEMRHLFTKWVADGTTNGPS
jgi:ribosomal protein S18 acetylase RimI-like enzyme